MARQAPGSECENMRDPTRIDRIIDLLRTCWHSHPDQRLGQLIINICQQENMVFYKEDDAIEDLIRKYIVQKN